MSFNGLPRLPLFAIGSTRDLINAFLSSSRRRGEKEKRTQTKPPKKRKIHRTKDGGLYICRARSTNDTYRLDIPTDQSFPSSLLNYSCNYFTRRRSKFLSGHSDSAVRTHTIARLPYAFNSIPKGKKKGNHFVLLPILVRTQTHCDNTRARNASKSSTQRHQCVRMCCTSRTPDHTTQRTASSSSSNKAYRKHRT